MELSWLRSGKTSQSHSYLPIADGPENVADDTTIGYDRTENVQEIDATQERVYNKVAKWRPHLLLAAIVCSAVVAILLLTHVATPTSPITLGNDAPPVATAVVSPFKSVIHPDPPTGLWGNVVKPYPTGAFWTNLVVNAGDGPIGVYPYGIKTLDVGIQVSYGAWRRIVSKTAITDNFVADLQLAAAHANAGSRAVEKHDKLSVTMGYKTVTNGKYRVHLVKSSPFVTVVYENAAPCISSNLVRILNVEAQTVKESTGVQYIVTLGNFQKWLVYCSDPLGLVWSGNTLTALAPIRGVVRVAILPVQNYLPAFNSLMTYVRRYATGGVVQLQYPSDRVAVVHIEYTTVGDGPLLMLYLPHQQSLLVEPNLLSDENINLQNIYTPIWCIKGRLKAVVGNIWRLQYNLNSNIGWSYQVTDKLPTDKLDEIARDLIREIPLIPPTATDAYGFGKQLQRLATMALLADNLGIADARRIAVNIMQTALTPWLSGTNDNPLSYDTTYGGLVTLKSLDSFAADFGSGWYNDHHFHYGYVIYAAAAIMKIDGAYFADPVRKGAIESIVKDVCNMDEADTQFPVARHKDYFDGHSWASGLWQQANGKGQESSSEAVNAYYGCYLYGLATSNTELSQFANTLLTMEIGATQAYWHMSGADIYDTLFANSRMVGNVGALDVTASTWFGNNAEFVHGINLMPITPATGALFDPAYVQLQYPVINARLKETHSDINMSNGGGTGGASGSGDMSSGKTSKAECDANGACAALGITGLCCPTQEGVLLGCCDSTGTGGGSSSGSNGSAGTMIDEWKSLIFADLAVVNRDAAWERLMTLSNFGAGNSKSNSLYWAATRAAPVPGFNLSSVSSSIGGSGTGGEGKLPSACAANSACDAIGMLGECCPSPNGLSLQCCPQQV